MPIQAFLPSDFAVKTGKELQKCLAFLCLLNYIKTCANLWYPVVVVDKTLKYK
jgi:hypothetical protein